MASRRRRGPLGPTCSQSAPFGKNWSGKIEYLYLNMGTKNFAFTNIGIPQGFNSEIRENIFRVGLNTAKDMRRSAWSRKVKPLGTEEIMLVAREPMTGAALEDEESLRLLRSAIADLRADEKEVFLLRQNGSLTYEQIAEIRQAPVGTVKTQMRSALQKLRSALNPESPD